MPTTYVICRDFELFPPAPPKLTHPAALSKILSAFKEKISPIPGQNLEPQQTRNII